VRSPFKVIDGTPEPEGPLKRLKASLPDTPIVRCPRCTGLAMLEVKLGMVWKNGKPTGGQKQIACATCMARGEQVLVA
jgi:hypothetical protein